MKRLLGVLCFVGPLVFWPLAVWADGNGIVPPVDSDGKHNLALKYLMGKGVPQDYDETLHWNLESAVMGHARASAIRSCLQTGKAKIKLGPAPKTFEDLSADSLALKRDAGFFYWRRSCDPADTAKAVELLTEAAEAGLPKAQYMMGIAFRQGRGVPLNFGVSAMWFRRAGAQGHKAAQRDFCRLQKSGHASGKGNDFRPREWCQ